MTLEEAKKGNYAVDQRKLMSYEKARAWLAQDIVVLSCYIIGSDGKISTSEIKRFNDLYADLGLYLAPDKFKMD